MSVACNISYPIYDRTYSLGIDSLNHILIYNAIDVRILKIATEIEYINGTSNEACLVLLNQYYLFLFCRFIS